MNFEINKNVFFLQEAVEEDRTQMAPPVIHVSTSLHSLSGQVDLDVGHRPSRLQLVSPAMSPSCSIDFLQDINKKSFREIFLTALPTLVHPVIILRLLAHKLFGNMIRRKTRYADAKLKPPKVNPVDSCPPRNDSDSEESKDTIYKRRKPNLHVQITDQPDEITVVKSGEKNHISRHNASQKKNGTTKMALRAIGKSLVTPLDLNINNGASETAATVTTTTVSPEGECKSTTSRKLFRWPSKKRLSKSQVNVSSIHRESVVSLASQTSPRDSNNESTPDIDIMAFQRELINLPQFVMEAPCSDISPVFSRSSSVPENLASHIESHVVEDAVFSITGDYIRLHGNVAKTLSAQSGSENMPDGDSTVRITTTDADILSSNPDDNDSLLDGGSNILVHFEGPSSPLASSPSQSPKQNYFEYPNVTQLPIVSQQQSSSSASLSGSPKTLNASLSISSATSPYSDYSHIRVSSVCSTRDIPSNYKAVMKVIDTWIEVCSSDLDGNPLVVHEMRDFLNKMSILGHEYKQWCHLVGSKLHLEVSVFYFAFV